MSTTCMIYFDAVCNLKGKERLTKKQQETIISYVAIIISIEL